MAIKITIKHEGLDWQVIEQLRRACGDSGRHLVVGTPEFIESVFGALATPVRVGPGDKVMVFDTSEWYTDFWVPVRLTTANAGAGAGAAWVAKRGGAWVVDLDSYVPPFTW